MAGDLCVFVAQFVCRLTVGRPSGHTAGMNILFIGGTGNISTDCVDRLLKQGHDIILLTRGQSPAPAGCRLVKADRHDREAMQAGLRGLALDVAINFIGFDLPDVEVDFDILRDRISQYVFISSATVYAKPHRQLPITESAPLGNRFWEYARKKLRCEEWLLERHRDQQFPVTIVRPSHTFSPRWFPNVVSSGGWTFADRLLKGRPVVVPDDGNSLWTLTATSDFAVGLAGLVGCQKAIGQAYHITHDQPLTWNEIYRQTAEALGVAAPVIRCVPTDLICRHLPQLTGPLRGDKSNPTYFDNAKIKSVVTGFVCRKSFRQAIGESVEWHRMHPDRQTINPTTDALFDQIAALNGETSSDA